MICDRGAVNNMQVCAVATLRPPALEVYRHHPCLRWMLCFRAFDRGQYPYLVGRQVFGPRGHMQRAYCVRVECDMALCFVVLRRPGHITPVLEVFEGFYDIIAEPWFEDTLSGEQYCNTASRNSLGMVAIICDLNRATDVVPTPLGWVAFAATV